MKMVECSYCDGSGLIMVYSHEEGVDPETDVCPICNGVGELDMDLDPCSDPGSPCYGCTLDKSGDTCADCNPYSL